MGSLSRAMVDTVPPQTSNIVKLHSFTARRIGHWLAKNLLSEGREVGDGYLDVDEDFELMEKAENLGRQLQLAGAWEHVDFTRECVGCLVFVDWRERGL